MRFFSNGPNIPDLLLEKRDQGQVVFLCGAGVSVNSGMPDFIKLTKKVIDFFDPQKNSQIITAFQPWHETKSGNVPLDQIFQLLYQEYGQKEVNSLVAKNLQYNKLSKNIGREHKIISRISSNQEGRPQIVTTNFDRLFEHDLKIKSNEIYEPPALPNINLGLPITGITYLHGRVKNWNSSSQSYVLSSGDFGRAYLSEGWATNFIRTLLEKYTVVLLGYKAEDPPVKYLLQGLNHNDSSNRSNLYAFDRGTPEDIETRWRDRGVTPIACESHDLLWQSLEAWAERADDPRSWRKQILTKALKSPRQLEAHERGQVAHLVRTTAGAKLFASNNSHAEWICVFDAACRTAKQINDYNKNEIFNNLDMYGLDDDPKPSESIPNNMLEYDHIFEWRAGDTTPTSSHALTLKNTIEFEKISPRLEHLILWIVKNINSPIIIWWAVKQQRLHPYLIGRVRWMLTVNKDLHPMALHHWHLILDYQSTNLSFTNNRDFFRLKDRIKTEGWTPRVLLDLETTIAPYISLDTTFGITTAQPPLKDWEDLDGPLVNWKIKFPDWHGEKIEVPENTLNEVFL
jgi:SIR2-like domain